MNEITFYHSKEIIIILIIIILIVIIMIMLCSMVFPVCRLIILPHIVILVLCNTIIGQAIIVREGQYRTEVLSW